MRNKYLSKMISMFLVSILIVSNSFIGFPTEKNVFAASLPDGVQDFRDYKIIDGIHTSPDGFFTITSSKTPIEADEFGAFINSTTINNEETVYMDIKANSMLGSFELEKLYMGEYFNDSLKGGHFKDIVVTGYANDEEVFSTLPHTESNQDIMVENFPIDYSPAIGKTINSFRITYTKSNDNYSQHIGFNLVNFTITNASVNPPMNNEEAPAFPMLPFTQTFDLIPAGTESEIDQPLKIDGMVYSTDALNEALAVETIRNSGNTIGSGHALNAIWYGTNTGTYFQFESENQLNNFKMTSLELDMWDHGSRNAEKYTVTGYDDGIAKVSVLVDFKTPNGLATTYLDNLSSPNSELSWMRNVGPTGDFTGGKLIFKGSLWSNLDMVRFTVADTAPNTILGAIIDNIVLDPPIDFLDDSIAPAINNSNIYISNVTSSGITLNWDKATDNVTSQENLEYQVYQSGSSNIDTVSNVEANGTALGQEFTKDMNTFGVTGLSPNTTYYFNVLVKDAAGNKSVYSTKEATISPNSKELPAVIKATGTPGTWTDLGTELTDGEQGSDDISGKDFEIYYTDSDSGDTRTDNIGLYVWEESEFNDPSSAYEGERATLINSQYASKYGGDGSARTHLVIKTIDGSEFKFDGFHIFNSLGLVGDSSKITVVGYRDSVKTGEVTLTVADDPSYISKFNSTELEPSIFQNVDRVVIKRSSAAPDYNEYPELWYCFNSFAVDNPIINQTPATPALAANNMAIADRSSVIVGEDIILTATGDRQSATGSVINDERYIPLSWSSSENDKNGNFTESNGVYTSTYTSSISGDYNISVVFQKQLWDGDSWINAVGQTDTKTVNVIVNRPLDMMPPLPGNNGLIISSDVTPIKVNLVWAKATDNATQQGDLEYEVYQSSSDNIDTVNNIEANGTALGQGFMKDLNTFAVTGLTPNTTYYFNVLVKDAAGNKSVYTMQQIVTQNLKSNNADLSNLTISSGPLNTAFNKDTVNYTAIVPSMMNGMTVIPTFDDSKATAQLRINDQPEIELQPFYLNDGKNTIDIIVTAEDRLTTKTYSVTVYRLLPPPTVSANDANNSIIGINPSMEFQINGGAWTTFNLANLPDLSGDKTVKVRYIANIIKGEPTNEETILTFTTNPKTASAPTITSTVTKEDTISENGLVITPHAEDADDVTHYKISDITGGVLYKNDGVSTIENGYFITKAEGQSGLKFLPYADTNSMAGDTYAFKVQASLDVTGLGLSDFTSGRIAVTEVNDEPNANSDSLPSIDENSSSFNIPLTDLLSNDWAGPDNESGQTLMITNVQSVEGGTVRLDGNHIVFTPNPNYRGTARFNYTIMDDGTTNGAPDPKTDESMALIPIKPRADQPTVTDAVTNEDEKSSDGLVITPANADGATTTHYKITGITGGSLYKNDGAFPIVNGDFITVSEGQAGLKFQPAEDQYGTTGFGFLIQAAPSDDGRKLSDAIQASIIVKEVNDNPIATDDQLPNKELNSGGISITFEELLQNDLKGPENENGQTLTITSVENAVGGTATIQDGKIIFIPNGTGSASFDYTVRDNGTTNGNADSLTDSAKVQFTVVSKPVIQLQGNNPMYIELGSTYLEPGYSAMDEVDGDLTGEVNISGAVNNNQLGIYPLNYNLVNSNGISAIEMTRTVQVVSADLQTLSVSAGNLMPEFDKVQSNYNLTVPSNTATIDVSASTLDMTANASINSHAVGNGGNESIPLQPGANTITIEVAANGGLTKTYTLHIIRELTNAKAPTISQQPTNQTVTVDVEANLTVAAATDKGTLSYQWYSNTTNSTTDGKLIPGAIGATYSAPTAIAGITYYYVVVTNTDNNASGRETATATSEVAAVTVNAKSINAYLADLTLSSGALSPAFTKNRETYTVNVANSVSAITFIPTVEETGKATVTVNGQPAATAVPLTIGANKIKVVVTAEDGVTQNTYTITVNRAQPATNDGGGSTPAPQPEPQPEPQPNPAPVPAPQPTTEQIVVDVDGSNGSNLAKTPITRTTETDGTVKDKVAMTDAIAKETVQKAKEQGVDTARIMIPDKQDKVSEIVVEIPQSALVELNNGSLKLEIVTPNAVISIPTKSLDQFNGDLYFRIVPVKSDSEKQQVEERAKNESLIQEAVGNSTVQVIGRPMEIETNMQSREVAIVLPLTASLPKNAAERENLLNNLGVYIEHSDGSKELIKGMVVKMQDGSEGLQFTVNKFSTFTMVYLEGWEEEAKEEADKTLHTPYIKGYANSEFRPDAPVTRAQMATMLAKNLDAAPSASTYKDVSKKHGAYDAILEVREAGIMTGKTADAFDPNGTVTRAQMAAIVHRWILKQCEQDAEAYASCGIAANLPAANFTDVKGSHWAKEAMDFTKAADIMVGEGDKFRPEANLTRAQAVKVLNRLFKRGPLTVSTAATFTDVPATHWAFGEIEEAAREHSSSLDKKE
ncbi:cadherin-like beta sandwich domain-containing protein [Solibacillus silvestris]|uniref:cadherin-like beta sandwich domain-containing protein n=1 Tax=Solibacillus silvestris TaxID=76853 RepID=UPI003F7E273A